MEDEIAGTLEAGQSFIQGYIALFGSRPSESAQQLVESRVTGAHNGNDDLDDLVNGTPDRVREWMHRKARLADGHSVGLPVCGVGSILSAFQEEQTGAKPWKKIEAHPTLDPLLLAELGLLRILAGATWREISQVTGKPLASCHRLLDTHKKLTLEPGDYAERVAWVTQRAARLCHD